MAAFSHDGRRLAMSERVIVTARTATSAGREGHGGGWFAVAQLVFFEPKTAAMASRWSPDDTLDRLSEFGGGFETRNTPARIVMMMRRWLRYSHVDVGGQGAGFPSLSPDGKRSGVPRVGNRRRTNVDFAF